jgi:hypothetical protein
MAIAALLPQEIERKKGNELLLRTAADHSQAAAHDLTCECNATLKHKTGSGFFFPQQTKRSHPKRRDRPMRRAREDGDDESGDAAFDSFAPARPTSSASTSSGGQAKFVPRAAKLAAATSLASVGAATPSSVVASSAVVRAEPLPEPAAPATAPANVPGETGAPSSTAATTASAAAGVAAAAPGAAARAGEGAKAERAVRDFISSLRSGRGPAAWLQR